MCHHHLLSLQNSKGISSFPNAKKWFQGMVLWGFICQTS
jgi:hypothetical protein